VPADQLGAEVDDAEAAVWAVLGGEPAGDAALAAGLDPFELTEAAAVYRSAGRTALEQAVTDTWQHLYIEFTDWSRAENVFAEYILPVLLQHQMTGQVRSWWFLRKHPCWRLRLLTPPGTVLPTELTDALNEAAKRRRLNGWWPGIYEAETAAFGGQEAMNAIHKLFAADSIATLTIRPTIKDFGERELSILLISTMARAAGLEWYEQGDLWDRVVAERPLPDGEPRALLTQMSKSLLPLLRTDTSRGSALITSGSPLHPAASWIDAFRTAGRQLGITARSGTAQRGLREVLSYVVIFHWNRLGLTAGAQAALAAAARGAFLDIHANTMTERPS
jgi:thiopeptide-type bacteriocin biosynthesis protein